MGPKPTAVDQAGRPPPKPASHITQMNTTVQLQEEKGVNNG